MKPENLLIVADSECDANMLYAVRLFIHEPFIHIRIGNESHIILGDLEFDRAKKLARHCHVHSLSQHQQRCAKEGRKPASAAKVIQRFLAGHGIRKVMVPANFPHGLARELRRLNIRVKVKHGSIFPERELKTADEVKKISAALMMAEVGLAEGIQVLRRAKIAKDGKLLIHNNVPLTVEKMRGIIEIAVIQAGGQASHTIVACGRQTSDPHERGSGLLQANQPIIIDIFPRSQKTGYFGDITRTVVRGRASEELRRMYHTVVRAQDLAFSNLRPGTAAREIHQTVRKLFDLEGFKTSKTGGRMQGFLQGTGHGLGLEAHESPRIAQGSADVLRAGHVVTVEPGLYYHPAGGVRIEDVALITNQEPKNLTKFEKVLEV